MLNNFLQSPCPLVIPLEAFHNTGDFVMREANHLTLPFVSFEKQPAPAIIVGNMSRPLFVPVIVGAGQNRAAAQIAQCLMTKLAQQSGVAVKLLEAATLPHVTLPQADAIILVLPEYNYGFPNALKDLLEKNPADYAHRVIGMCDLSPGWFGGARLLETLLPLMRKFGLTPIFWDESSAPGKDFFDATRQRQDHGQDERIDKFLQEVVWMAARLRQRREISWSE